MRSVAVLAALASLLVKDVYAAAIPAVITDVVVVTEEYIVSQLPDGSFVTGKANPVGTSVISGTNSIFTTVRPYTSTSTISVSQISTSSSIVSSSSAAAVFVETKAVVPTTSSTPVYVAPTTLATSVAAVATSVASTSGSGKRGVAFNDESLLSAFTGSSLVTWSYNWASSCANLKSGYEFVPLLWGTGTEFTSVWAAAAQKALDAGSKHLLAFNEPDQPGQADIGYEAAAEGYMTYMQPFAGKAKLGSPSVTNGGGQMGLTYLSNFLNSCEAKGCTVDFISIHWYNGGDAQAFKDYVGKAYTAGGNRPIWITEFEAPGSSDAEKTAWLDEVLPWLDAQDTVERYSYFMASEGNLITGSVLSAIGKVFASLL